MELVKKCSDKAHRKYRPFIHTFTDKHRNCKYEALKAHLVKKEFEF
jgi:hypothetical protein